MIKSIHLQRLLVLFYISSTITNNRFVLFVHSKTVDSTFRLNGQYTEKTLTKFALSPRADGLMQIQVYSRDMYPQITPNAGLKLYLYSENSWENARKQTTCEDKVRFADKIKPFNFEINKDRDRTEKGKKWKAFVMTHVGDFLHNKPQYWYVTVGDCSLEIYYHDNAMPTLSVRSKIMENRGDTTYSHLSYDEVGLGKLHVFNSLLSFLLAGSIFVYLVRKARRQEEVHLATLLVMSGCTMHGLSSFFATAHLAVYINNGVGSYALDALSAHLEALVDSTIAWVLLAVGVGWTMPSDISIRSSPTTAAGPSVVSTLQGMRGNTKGNSNNNSNNTTPSTSVVIAVALVVSHAILCQWGRTYDDEFDCYHDLEHLPGRIFLFFRFFLAIVFLFCITALRQHCNSHALHRFLVKFAAVGASWFVCLPSLAMVVSSSLFNIAYHRRHPIMTMSSLALQFVSLSSLTWLFMGNTNRTAYHKICTMNVGDASSLSSGIQTPSVMRFRVAKVRLD